MTRQLGGAGRAGVSLAVIALLAGLAGCTGTEPTGEREQSPPAASPSNVVERGPQPIVGWANGGDIQVVHLGTCHGEPVVEVEETTETVTITVTSTFRDPSDACQDTLRVQLKEDLGDRTVIDGATGEPPPGIEG